MKQLVCEMCGSTDLVKQDGVFICQTCGCKYSVEEAKKMMVEGTVQVEGTVHIDNSNNLDSYKELAINEYNSGNTDGAYQYFMKVLEIDPTDYQSLFYKGMCLGWKSTLANPRISEAVAGFQQAYKYIPSEISQKVSELFLSDLINLITAWFEKARERVWDTDEWYSYNVDTFWDYLGVCEKVINIMESFKSIFLASESGAFRKCYGQLYCDACYGYCTNIVEWTDYSKTNATFPGISLNGKKPVLQKYDDVIFEVRKYDPKFKKIEVKGTLVMGTIDRAAPPTRIGSHNMAVRRQNEQNCIAIDRQIDQRVAKWKEDEQKRIKAEKEKKYWETHAENKAEADRLKAELNSRTSSANSAKTAKDNADKLVKKLEDTISDLERKISAGNDLIAKKQKAFFGKAKAQELIEQTQKEIEGYQRTIAETNQSLVSARNNRDNTSKIYNEASSAMTTAKNTYEGFIKKCGL